MSNTKLSLEDQLKKILSGKKDYLFRKNLMTNSHLLNLTDSDEIYYVETFNKKAKKVELFRKEMESRFGISYVINSDHNEKILTKYMDSMSLGKENLGTLRHRADLLINMPDEIKTNIFITDFNPKCEFLSSILNKKEISEVNRQHLFYQLGEYLSEMHKNNLFMRTSNLDNFLYDEEQNLNFVPGDFIISRNEPNKNKVYELISLLTQISNYYSIKQPLISNFMQGYNKDENINQNIINSSTDLVYQFISGENSISKLKKNKFSRNFYSQCFSTFRDYFTFYLTTL